MREAGDGAKHPVACDSNEGFPAQNVSDPETEKCFTQNNSV